MGVTGLWRLIEPAGKPVPVETLENKVLAVDISIWLHQMVKGYQDAKGAPLANAHLMGLFQRLCKLLYFRIKPVFVFDGAFPALKRDTISKRQDAKQKYNSESERIKRELAILLTKKTAIGSLLGKQISPKKASKPTVQTDEDMFKLPAIPAISQNEDEESESDDEESSSSSSAADLHSIDLESQKFKTLPAKEKYDLLLELKETRKMNSWGRLHELPKKSDNFSDFQFTIATNKRSQLQRLLKRRKVQECLEETEKEIGDASMSLNELESLLNEEGIETKFENLPTRRIASNNTTRFLLINDVKQALADAKKKKEAESLASTSKDDLPSTGKEVGTNAEGSKKDELEEDLELAIKMSLECVNDDEVAGPSKTDDSWTSYVSDGSEYYKTDSEEEEGCEPPDMTSAKAYIIQYSDYTNQAIDHLTRKTSRNKNKGNKKTKLDEVLEDLNCRKSQMVEGSANLSSSDDEVMNTDSDVIEVVTVNSDDETNNTQAFVAILDNPTQEVITLDSSMDSEKTPEKDLNSNETNVENIEESNSSSDDLIEVAEIEKMIKDKIQSETNDSDFLVSEGSTTKAVSSVESNNQFDVESMSTDISENVADVKKQTYKPPIGTHTANKNDPGSSDIQEVLEVAIEDVSPVESESNNQFDVESDSTDNDFEDVPAVDNKPVIELTLNVNETLEDDIFADVFMAPNKARGENSVAPEVENKSTKSNQNLENEDDELQKAIMMSLECVDDNNVPLEASKVVTDNTKEIQTVKEAIKESSIDTMSKVTPQGSKTLESLNKILLAESTTPVNLTDTDTTTKKNTEPISKEQLNSMVEEIQNEEEGLQQEKGRLDRIGRNITEQMKKEAQELLQIFGIPYIVAPMEAEAQCAFLESVNLTDGTITDDSDIWLFGGKTVYKNFFNQKKHVLQFLSERIEKSFNLSREQLILLALLVGSDYTTGIDGVGPVTAMEILASFPFKRKLSEDNQTRYKEIITGLQEFKQWVRGGRRTDNTTLKKKLRNIVLNDDFPSVRVVQAYLDPNIEKSEDKFSWGELDITILRDYTKAKFGWSQNKLDEIIKPVLKRLVERKSQKSMHDFFKKKTEILSLEDQMSKRVKAAVQRIGPKSGEHKDEFIEGVVTTKEKQAKRKVNKEIEATAGPSKPKKKKTEESVLKNLNVKVVSEVNEGKSGIEIKINKTDRFQEIIPQREKDKQSLLQNKMKAIELFRKTNIDKKKKLTKRKPLVPKDKAELSESDSD